MVDVELIRTTGDERLMCPNTLAPVHPAHMLTAHIADIYHEAAEFDAEGEMLPAAGVPYEAVQSSFGDAMLLYSQSVTATVGGTLHVVESWWWRCGVCGLVLPATARIPRHIA